MVGSDHFHQLWLDNMPQFLVGKAPFYDANWYNEEREFGLPRMLLRGPRGAVGLHPARGPRRRVRPRVLQRAADRPLDHLPDHHAAARRPTCRSCRSTPTSSRRRCPGRSGSCSSAARSASWSSRGRATSASRSSAPGTCRWSSAARASSGRTGRTRSSTASAVEWIANGDIDGLPGRGDAGQPARAGQRHPRVHGLHADDGRRRRRDEGRPRRHPRPVPHHGGLLHLVPERSAGTRGLA